MNNDGNVPFENGDLLLKKYEATYLGNEIRRANIKQSIEQHVRSSEHVIQVGTVLESVKCESEMATNCFSTQ